jgi:hypothetical protein
LPELDPDSDEDLFSSKKNITSPTKIIEKQNTTNTENENGKAKFKDISVKKFCFSYEENAFINFLVSFGSKSINVFAKYSTKTDFSS